MAIQETTILFYKHILSPLAGIAAWLSGTHQPWAVSEVGRQSGSHLLDGHPLSVGLSFPNQNTQWLEWFSNFFVFSLVEDYFQTKFYMDVKYYRTNEKESLWLVRQVEGLGQAPPYPLSSRNLLVWNLWTRGAGSQVPFYPDPCDCGHAYLGHEEQLWSQQ